MRALEWKGDIAKKSFISTQCLATAEATSLGVLCTGFSYPVQWHSKHIRSRREIRLILQISPGWRGWRTAAESGVLLRRYDLARAGNHSGAASARQMLTSALAPLLPAAAQN